MMDANFVNTFIKAGKDDDLCDVVLVGSDGGKLPAVKFLLAANSEVFKGMFYGQFKESASNEVELNFTSKVLRVMYEICCSGMMIAQQHLLVDYQCDDVLDLISAGSFFRMTNIIDAISDELLSILIKKPQWAFKVHKFAVNFDEPSIKKLNSNVFRFIEMVGKKQVANIDISGMMFPASAESLDYLSKNIVWKCTYCSFLNPSDESYCLECKKWRNTKEDGDDLKTLKDIFHLKFADKWRCSECFTYNNVGWNECVSCSTRKGNRSEGNKWYDGHGDRA